MESRLGTILESLVCLAIRNYFSLAHSLKPCGKWKENISISEGTLLIQTSCKWARKVHTITKTRPKTKTRGKKRKHTSLGLEEGPAGREEQHCPQVVTLAQVGLFHVNPRSGSSARALEDLNRQEDSRPGPSPPLPSPPDERAEGRVWPTPKSPHDWYTVNAENGVKTKGPTISMPLTGSSYLHCPLKFPNGIYILENFPWTISNKS